jgi:quercetin dioxygenase-like cupin family protein
VSTRAAHADAVERPAPRWFVHNLVRVHLDAAATGGAFDLVELTGAPGDMPPLHVHGREDETFVVLEGELALHVGEATTRVPAGCAALAPRGVPHVYEVVSSTPARWLVVSSPSGFARFVREASDPAAFDALPPADTAPDMERLDRAAAEAGIELLAPPGALPTDALVAPA